MPSDQDLVVLLGQCSECRPILDYIKTDGKIDSLSDSQRRNISNFILSKNGVLQHLFQPRVKNINRCRTYIHQVYVPKVLRRDIFLTLHDSLMHTRLDQLYIRLREFYYWPAMYKDLGKYLLECSKCGQKPPPSELSVFKEPTSVLRTIH